MQPNPINIPVAGNEMMTVVLTKLLLNPSFLLKTPSKIK